MSRHAPRAIVRRAAAALLLVAVSPVAVVAASAVPAPACTDWLATDRFQGEFPLVADTVRRRGRAGPRATGR